MNGYGAGGVITTGIGQMAYTGVNTLGLAVLAACLVVAGLMMLRLVAVRRAVQHERETR